MSTTQIESLTQDGCSNLKINDPVARELNTLAHRYVEHQVNKTFGNATPESPVTYTMSNEPLKGHVFHIIGLSQGIPKIRGLTASIGLKVLTDMGFDSDIVAYNVEYAKKMIKLDMTNHRRL